MLIATKEGVLFQMANSRKTATKENIEDALFSLMKNKKLNEITIYELCDKAGVNRTSFYRNYNTKEDVVNEYLTKITDNFVKNNNISLKLDNINEFIIILFKHLESHKDIAYNLYKSDCLYLIENQFKRIFDNKNIYTNKYKIRFYCYGIYSIFHEWLLNNFKESPEELATILKDLLNK